MATKIRKSAEEIRQDALKMLRKAKAMIIEEQNETKMQLGTLVEKHIEGEINFKAFQSEVKKITGKEFSPDTKFKDIIAAGGEDENK
jgi:hypothetical protein